MNRAPFLSSGAFGPCLGSALLSKRFLVLPFVVVVVPTTARLIVFVTLLPEVTGEMTALPAVVAGRCFGCHGYTAAGDLPFGPVACVRGNLNRDDALCSASDRCRRWGPGISS